ncbi:MAG TPA: DUF433 domain-containing protein [Mycobacteriales bacterium]|nr:DUF433 domain-containing protein [Mycobacteriales bacterium]
MAKLTYLERPVYGMTEVDELLSLSSGTARRWIDGYERRGRHYDPVVRHESTDSDLVTWGEFVETRLLAQYRDAGVPMLRMRPVVEAGTGQYVLAPPARSFKRTVEFEDVDNLGVVTRIRPLGLKREVVIDPDRRSGAPVVRAVPTDVLAELIRAGEPIEWVAKQYDLTLDQVLDAWEYERSQAA